MQTQAAPRLAGTGTDPRIEATTVQADIPISDTYPGDGVAKTVYFANASAGTITLAFQITGTPILTLTAGAAFGDVEQVPKLGYLALECECRLLRRDRRRRLCRCPVHGSPTPMVTTSGYRSTFVQDVDAPTASFQLAGERIRGSAAQPPSPAPPAMEQAPVWRWLRIMTQTSATWVTATGRDPWSYSWTPPAGENGIVHTLYARATDYLNQVQSPSATRVVTVDNVMTGIVSNLHSTTHTPSVWSNQATIDVAWTAASDGAGSGLAGYSVLWDTSASTTPDTIQDLAGSATSDECHCGGWYSALFPHSRGRCSGQLGGLPFIWARFG